MNRSLMPSPLSGGCMLVLRENPDEQAWDELIAKLGGNFRQTVAWSRWCQQRSGQAAYFTIEKAGQPAAAGWHLVLSPPLSRGRVQQAVFETLPCFDRERISAPEVFATVLLLARREQWISFSFGNSSREYLPGADHCEVADKLGFRIDLSRSPAQILARCREQHRKRIRKAGKGPLAVRIVTDGQALAYAGALDRLFQYTYEKHVSRGKERPRPAASSVSDAVRDLVLTGKAVLFIALHGQEPVCFNMVSTFPGKAQGLFLASSASGYELNASYLVMYRMIEYFHDRGYPYLDIGEVPRSAESEGDPDHGLYIYKKGYNADMVPLCSGTMVLRPVLHRALTALAQGKRALSGLVGRAPG